MTLLHLLLLVIFLSHSSHSQRCGPDCSICNDGGATFCNADDVNRCIWNGMECVIEQCGPNCELCDGIDKAAECNDDPLCVYLNKNDLCRLENTCSADCSLCLGENDCIDVGEGGNECLWINGNLCIPKPPPTLNPTGFPTVDPTPSPTQNPTILTTQSPTKRPTSNPSLSPSPKPTANPAPKPSPAPFTIPTPKPIGSDSAESSESSDSESSEQSTINAETNTNAGDKNDYALKDLRDSSKEVEEKNEIEIVSEKSKENQRMLVIIVAVGLFLFLFMITCLVFCAWKQCELSNNIRRKHSHVRVRSIEMDDIDGLFEINGGNK